MDKVSIIVTVFNEEKTVEGLLEVLCKFRAEIIIVDGGSTDKTIEIIKRYKKVKLICGRYGRSEGRNVGVVASKGNILVFTDAGCIPEPNWFKEITKPFLDPKVECVSGFYKGLPSNIFEKCLVPYVLVMPDHVGDEFLPSSRSMAIRRELFIKADGFDHGLDTSEDFEFAHRLKAMGTKFYFAKEAIVGWYPRKDLKSTAWMFFKFAATDIHAGILRNKVKLLAIRYYVFMFLIFLYWPVVVLLLGYLIWAVLKNYKYVKDIRAFFWLPVLQLTADICVLLGTMAGLLSKVSLGR